MEEEFEKEFEKELSSSGLWGKGFSGKQESEDLVEPAEWSGQQPKRERDVTRKQGTVGEAGTEGPTNGKESALGWT